MTARRLSGDLVREAPLIRRDDTVTVAVKAVIDSGLPALPVVGDKGLIGIFGEREFMGALFPGYLKELSYAGFVPSSLDEVIEKRAACRDDPVEKYTNTERIKVPSDFSDTQLAETFIHHRVLIVPVTERRQVIGVVTRSDFFRFLGEKFLGAG